MRQVVGRLMARVQALDEELGALRRVPLRVGAGRVRGGWIGDLMDETGGGVCCNMEAPHGQGTWIHVGEHGDHYYTGESRDGEYHGRGRLVQGGR